MKRRLMRLCLKAAQRLGFPFGGITVTRFHPDKWSGPVDTPSDLHIDLTWRGQRIVGYVVPEELV